MTSERGPAADMHGRLDALVTRVASEFMSVSAVDLADALERALQTMTEFFDVDTSFLRRNDFERDLTVLVAEWPRRENVPDPDPLGEVPFDVDPVFAATRALDQPFVLRPESSDDAYQERVEQGAGVPQVSMAMVPLISEATTVGVLGFIKFGDRPWDVAETNALQAVASLIVQLQSRVAAEEKLQYQAYHDDLTKLPNRRALLEDLDRRIAEREPMTLLFIDLDGFKSMNDSLGHGAGDRLLSTMAERLRRSIRPEDLVARLAGDEFVVLLETRSTQAALEAAARLLGVIAEPIAIADHQITRTASIGIAVTQRGHVHGDELLAHADVALHRAKQEGGNRSVVFDDGLRRIADERSETEIRLREAITAGQLRLHYQPEIDLRTGELLAVEALVRWQHPEHGLLDAGRFIAVAEESGMIVDLGNWVMAEACRQMAEWRLRYPRQTFTMRINMSPAQLATRNIVELVGECLADNELPGRLVCFEITEHAVMQDIDRAIDTLHELKSLGVSLAIDDFGTGYSSMAQLKRLPVDALKIDQTFVAGLATDGGDRAIVDATIRLAKSFGLDVVAEGIETQDLVALLLALGCFRAQGYLLCRPIAADALEDILGRGGIDPAILVAPAVTAETADAPVAPVALARVPTAH